MQETESGTPEQYANWKAPEEDPAIEENETQVQTAEAEEKEQLIQEEKKRILQEKLDEFFEELRALDQKEIASLIKSGFRLGGQAMESASLGSLDEHTAQNLARAFQNGLKLVSQILEQMPDLLERFDEELTQEAKRRVEENQDAESEESLAKPPEASPEAGLETEDSTN